MNPISSAASCLLLVGVLGVGGCHRSAINQPVRNTSAPRVQSDPLASLDQLEGAIASLDAAADPLQAKDLAEVVSCLGKALEPISHAEHLRVEEIAKKISAAPLRSLSRSGWMKQALERIIHALIAMKVAPTEAPHLQMALRLLGQAKERVDELLPLEDQRPRLTQALHAAANAIFVARGGAPPFDDVLSSSRPRLPLGDYARQLSDARRAVADVARIPLMGTEAASGRVLLAFADLLRAADPSGRTAAEARELRFQATRLQRAAPLAHGEAEWIHAGLVAALKALHSLSGDERSDWSDEAERAIAAIDDESPLSFQRAAIQDAFRTSVDAFGALSNLPVDATTRSSP